MRSDCESGMQGDGKRAKREMSLLYPAFLCVIPYLSDRLLATALVFSPVCWNPVCSTYRPIVFTSTAWLLQTQTNHAYPCGLPEERSLVLEKSINT